MFNMLVVLCFDNHVHVLQRHIMLMLYVRMLLRCKYVATDVVVRPLLLLWSAFADLYVDGDEDAVADVDTVLLQPSLCKPPPAASACQDANETHCCC